MARYAVAVQITTPSGVFTVIDPTKPKPHYEKFPGGKSEGDETPEECAVREIAEEVGVEISVYELTEKYREQRKDHVFVFFQADLSIVPPHKAEGEEGEIVNIVPLDKLLPNLFPVHRRILELVTAQ